MNRIILDEYSLNRSINRISFEIIEQSKGIDELLLIGVLSRGADIANRIAKKINETENCNIKSYNIDITQYRDDRQKKITNMNNPISIDVNKKKVIIIDDVIYTGRTARCAIDLIMDIGRPSSIKLAVIIDRGHRELPIKPDFVGKNLPTSKNETVKVMIKPIDTEDLVVIIRE